jgi:peptidoglycan/LPS O-acetylase OafA/YrhL
MQTPQTTSHARYAALDGIRGLAILFVLLSHIANRIDGRFAGLGQFGVWLFFVLSSFLLSLYFFDRPERMRQPVEWLNYFMRRFLRIYPLFILASVGAVLIGWWTWSAVARVLLLQYPGWWAIFVEFRFYFLLPVIVAVLYGAGRIHRLLPWGCMAAAFLAHYAIFPVGTTVPGYDPDRGVTTVAYEYIIVFVTGCFTAWLFVSVRDALAGLRRSLALDLALGAAVVVPFCLSGPILGELSGRDIDVAWYHLDWAPWGLYFAMLILGVMLNDGYTRRILASPPLRFLGLVSYSVYMGMDFVINPISDFAVAVSPPLAYLSAVPIILLAWVSFSVIERPLSRITLIGPRARWSHALPVQRAS